VYLSTNYGASWTPINEGLANSNVGTLTVGGTYLFAGTSGDGCWRRPLSEMLTDVESAPWLATQFAQQLNYPNPFNPSTTIRYELPHASQVSLKVYNTLGQEVATLVNETKPGGAYTVEFNAGNLASGVYLYRLQAGNFVETRKLVVLR
jgi:hypothetical protein